MSKKLLALAIGALLLLPSCAAVQEDLFRIKKVKAPADIDGRDVPALLDRYKIPFEGITCVNWEEAYPYCPEASFRIAHTGDAVLLHFKVKEEAVLATASRDNGPVWRDSCVEFFVSPGCDDTYYNIESNCVGNILLQYGKKGTSRPTASPETISLIRRWSSLGREPITDPLTGDGGVEWEYVEIIPKEVFFSDSIVSFSGLEMTANFYKCGDSLPTPHFLSWAPIESERPQFHAPEFFRKIYFNK